jgi:hypothetical protein
VGFNRYTIYDRNYTNLSIKGKREKGKGKRQKAKGKGKREKGKGKGK